MNEKEKSSKTKQTTSAAPKRTYRKKTSVKEKTVKEKTAKTEKNTSVPAKTKTQTRKPKEVKKTPVKIIPLGGLNEIGKNMTVFECSNDMFILDCGLAFPDADMPGVDIVIPDFTYVERNKEKIRGIVITHGHEDHIGGLAYLLKKINVPVYATRLTIGLIEGKLKEQGLSGKVTLNVVEPKKTVKMGCMAVEFIKVNHSIPDSVGMAIHTPAGVIVHTGDFKVDYSPIDGKIIDLARFGELGSRGVLALMADSTNAERPGYTHSERTVGESFDKLFQKGEGKRIIIATFSSNIHRVQQIINCAVKYGRKVAIFGRSMVNVINTAIELGYLDVPDGIIIDIEMMNRYESERIVLITTGSQGEPMSALTRMAMNDHKKVNITPMDFIIISATPIPGNEKFVTRVVNELMKSGAEVVYEAMYEVHVSGHACQEELKLMQALIKPKFFIPVHGEYKHLKKHADLARQMGLEKENVIIAEIGNVIETDGNTMKIVSQVPAGRVLVDGLGVGDVGSIVLRDRKHLAQDGLIIIVIGIEKNTNEIVAGPDIISRGFVYVRESEELMVEARGLLSDTLANCSSGELREWNSLKGKLRDALSDYIYQKTKRSPMILPIIMET
ncbi:MAG: RNase J family beta-CASP ribonuclease [Ruminococcus sp.]|uniref:RNase J family beta-CASP ribonuclease n=1 Tax=Ruminococcus sp. TaxID=41978 RepID=UPI0025F9B7B6|nr:RNase J family beta-CASP ribonuclease [Ruminococcus sp.]MCR5601860.1 RNase J family beta-CASP ribonuclease [Ruminococcus sp.]